MNIIEVKNNLVKFGYEENLGLANLILIKDSTKSYIAQVIHVESLRTGKYGIAKLIFNFDNKIKAYDGSIPAIKSSCEILSPDFIKELTNSDNQLILGKLAGFDNKINVSFDLLKDNPIILSEKFYITKYLLNNLALQIQARHKKLVVFDTAGVFKTNRLSLTKDFKLPLNADNMEYICEESFTDTTVESRAMIQSIFEELEDYAKTVEFIPFDSFKSVIDSEFERTKLMQLIIMKQKLRQLRNMEIFAQNETDLGNLKTKLSENQITVIDVSKVNKGFQAQTIKYVYSILKTIDDEFYAVTPLSGNNKKVLNTIFDTENTHTTIICDYDYANLNELKKVSKNMIMFTPQREQKDFGGYKMFLQRLAEDEFIVYGKVTKFIPLIGKLYVMSSADMKDITILKECEVEQVQQAPATQETPEAVEEAEINEEHIAESEELGSDIKAEPEDVVPEQLETDAIEHVSTEPENIEPSEQEAVEPAEQEEPFISEEETVETEEEAVSDNEELLTDDEHVEADNVQDVTEIESESEISVAEPEEVEEIEANPIEEITAPEISETDTIEEQITKMASATADSVTVEPDEIQTVLNEIPDIEDDEELSDDDLDMIEKLSKPDEEITVLNEQETQEPIVDTDVTEVVDDVQDTQQDVQETVQPTVEPEEEPDQQDNTSQEDEESEENIPKQVEPLQTRSNSTPSVPEYSAEIPSEDRVFSDSLQQGDRVFHSEFGEGVVEKMINYGDKLLCSINFTNVGRRLLNPEISELRKI